MREREQHHDATHARREIAKRIGIGMFGLLIGVPIYDNFIDERIRTPELLRERDELVYWLSNEYGIDAVFLSKGSHTNTEWTELTGLKSRVNVLREIQREIVKYPASMMRKVPVQNLWLVDRLIQDGNPLGGLASDNQIFVACAFGNSIMRTLHHENQHICDKVDALSDEEWVLSNPSGFEYIGYARYSYKRLEDQRPKGFAQFYGTVSVKEDMATVAEGIFSDYAGMEKTVRDEDDDVLRKKIDLIKKSYSLLSDGQMNDHFWDDLLYRPHTIRKGYWESRMRATKSPGFIQRRLSLRERRRAE